MWPKKPRFCKVVVVIGVVVGTGVAGTDDVVADGVVSGVPEDSGVLSWPRRPVATASSMEKIVARRIIDGFNTKR